MKILLKYMRVVFFFSLIFLLESKVEAVTTPEYMITSQNVVIGGSLEEKVEVGGYVENNNLVIGDKINLKLISVVCNESDGCKVNEIIENSDVQWSSEEENAATIDSNGQVMAKGEGFSYIRAEYDDKTYTFQIKVYSTLENIELSVGQSVLISPKATQISSVGYKVFGTCNDDVDFILITDDSPYHSEYYANHSEYYDIINFGDGECLLTAKKASNSILETKRIDKFGKISKIKINASSFSEANDIRKFVNVINNDTYYNKMVTDFMKEKNSYLFMETNSLSDAKIQNFSVTAGSFLEDVIEPSGEEGYFFIKYGTTDGIKGLYKTIGFLYKGNGCSIVGCTAKPISIIPDSFVSLKPSSLPNFKNSSFDFKNDVDNFLAKMLYFYTMEMGNEDSWKKARNYITTPEEMIEFVNNNSEFGYFDKKGEKYDFMVYLDKNLSDSIVSKYQNKNNKNNNNNGGEENPHTGYSIAFVGLLSVILLMILLVTRKNKKLYKI